LFLNERGYIFLLSLNGIASVLKRIRDLGSPSTVELCPSVYLVNNADIDSLNEIELQPLNPENPSE